MRVLLSVHEFPPSSLGSPGCKCLGIDISASAPAPGDEVGGAHLCLDGEDSLALGALDALLGGGFPFGERAVPAAVGED